MLNWALLSGSSVVALSMLGSPALAQSADVGPTSQSTAPVAAQAQPTSAQPQPGPGTPLEPAPEVEDGAIVVTGIRASLATAARTKRDSAVVVDSISAEDIGKLPDVSIADSLARLPGVTAQRLEGRDQRLSIRGLGPDFSTTLLNGREQVTVGDNRGVEFDQYPAEFFRQVDVYKAADASLIAAGISGTVDLRMLRPLDQPEDLLVVSARGEMNGIDKLNPDGTRYGWRATGTYVGKFANDTLGIAIGVSGTQTPSQNERYNAWDYINDPNGNRLITGAKPYVQSNLLKRYGVVATLEWEPSDNFHSTFDALYSNFTETQRKIGLYIPLGNSASVTDKVVDNGVVTGATYGNLFPVQANDQNERTADNFSFGWNNDIGLSDTVRLNIDASWSHAERTDVLLETYSGSGFLRAGANPDTIGISLGEDGGFSFSPTIDYSDTGIIKLTDPQGWGQSATTPVVQAGFVNRPKFEDDLKSLRPSLKGEFGGGSVFNGWEVGGNYSQRKKVSAFQSYYLCPPGGDGSCTVAGGTPTMADIPAEAVIGSVPVGYAGGFSLLALDPVYLYENVLDSVFDNRPVSLVRDNSVTEKVWTGYAKLSLDGEVGGKSVKGSLGAQIVHTTQSSVGSTSNLQVVNGVGVVTVLPASGEASYTNFLPSATLSVELERNLFVKMSASQTMVRPRLDQERINQELRINPVNIGIGGGDPFFSPFSSVGGNINLRPYQSLNLDLSVERYFTDGGYVALAGYFKNLTDFVDPNNNIAYDFSSALSLLTPAQQQQVLASGGEIGLFQTPSNSGKGTIAGIEATVSMPLRTIAPVLDGFGVFASGSYTQSDVRYASNPTQPIGFPGLSKWVASGTFYYEKHGFQARANYRYRSSFIGELAGLSANPSFRTADAEGILDAQIGYEFQNGPLTGLSLLLQAKNLTDEPFINYTDSSMKEIFDYQRYGPTYYLGATYKF
ncbi:TonB-dependent receptor [Sphingomonas sp. IW22]|uniref:TonB-dependent receptor n=1 Tax=Sphingomonas sp. IW22 TaxID=3242489 RepID=UPI0035207479